MAEAKEKARILSRVKVEGTSSRRSRRRRRRRGQESEVALPGGLPSHDTPNAPSTSIKPIPFCKCTSADKFKEFMRKWMLKC